MISSSSVVISLLQGQGDNCDVKIADFGLSALVSYIEDNLIPFECFTHFYIFVKPVAVS